MQIPRVGIPQDDRFAALAMYVHIGRAHAHKGERSRLLLLHRFVCQKALPPVLPCRKPGSDASVVSLRSPSGCGGNARRYVGIIRFRPRPALSTALSGDSAPYWQSQPAAGIRSEAPADEAVRFARKKGDILPSPPDRRGALFSSMPESASARHTALAFRDRLRRRPALLFPQPCTSAHRKLCDHSKKNGRNCQGITACLPQSRRKVRKQRSSSGSPPCSAPGTKTGFDRGPLRLRRIGSGEAGFDGKTSRRKPLRRPSEAGSTADQPFLPHICPFSRPY